MFRLIGHDVKLNAFEMTKVICVRKFNSSNVLLGNWTCHRDTVICVHLYLLRTYNLGLYPGSVFTP